MALPWTFANATTLFTSRLDDNYNALGALTIIPCTATGTNTIALTPAANTPMISAYSNMAPVFAFVASASATGNATININGIGAKNLYKNNGATAAGLNDIVSGGLYLVSYNSALNSAVGGFVLANPSSSSFPSPTFQFLTSGSSATYTPTSGAVRIEVTEIGGGGGGGATATNAGSVGGTTSFNGVTAVGGSGGIASSVTGRLGGAGGTGGTGTAAFRLPGSFGQGGSSDGASGGGNGAAGIFGAGAGQGGPQGGTAPGAGSANTGAGGGGASAAGAGAGGGGSGEYVQLAFLTATTYTYTVGAGGAGGVAGTTAGGAGGSGVIIVKEYYS